MTASLIAVMLHLIPASYLLYVFGSQTMGPVFLFWIICVSTGSGAWCGVMWILTLAEWLCPPPPRPSRSPSRLPSRPSSQPSLT